MSTTVSPTTRRVCARSTRALVAMSLLTTACTIADATPAPPRADVLDALASAKADGSLRFEPIELGAEVTGSVAFAELALYALRLPAGSEIDVTVEALDDTLEPVLTVVRDPDTMLDPTFTMTGAGLLEQSFAIEEGGLHYIAVSGETPDDHGRFGLDVRCGGATCRPETEVDPEGMGRCITRATTCALDRLPSYEGRLGPATAERLFGWCLVEDALTHLDLPCRAACEESGAPLCDAVKVELPWLADRSAACLGVLTECVQSCAELALAPESMEQTAANRCWGGAGGCVSFAAAHADCGGAGYESRSEEECFAYCRAVEGPWDEERAAECADGC